MTEPYKSLETKIRERQLQTVRERMEAAALKHGKVTAKEVAPEPITEEVEPVEEISKEKLGRYVKGAMQDVDQSSSELTKRHIRYNSFGDKDAAKGALALAAKHLKRKAGIEKAVDKLTYEPMRKEEVENIDELKKSTLGSYIQQAAKVLPAKEMELDNVYKHDLQKTIGFKPDHDKRVKVMKDIDHRERKITNHHKGIERAVSRLTKEDLESVEELTQPNPMQQKIAAQKEQVQKQKQQIQLQIEKQKAAKKEQLMKQKGQQELSKIKEEELEERLLTHPAPNNFGRAARFSRLHQQAYQKLASQGQLGRAELHRKRMIEWKRRAYMAHDNPEKLQR